MKKSNASLCSWTKGRMRQCHDGMRVIKVAATTSLRAWERRPVRQDMTVSAGIGNQSPELRLLVAEDRKESCQGTCCIGSRCPEVQNPAAFLGGGCHRRAPAAVAYLVRGNMQILQGIARAEMNMQAEEMNTCYSLTNPAGMLPALRPAIVFGWLAGEQGNPPNE